MSGSPADVATDTATYQGRLEFITTGKVYGWLHNQTHPAEECLVDLYVDGRFLGTHACNEHHEALSQLPGRNGFLVFNIPLPVGLLSAENCIVDVRIHGTGMSIPNSPIVTNLHRALIDTALSGMTPERRTLCLNALSETMSQTRRGRDRMEDPRLVRPAAGFEDAEVTVGAFLAHQLYRLEEARNFHLRSAADLTRFLVLHAEHFNLADHAWCPLPADVQAYLASGWKDRTGAFRSHLFTAYRAETGHGETGYGETGPVDADTLCDMVHWMFGKARLPKGAFAPEHVDFLNAPDDAGEHKLLSRLYAGMHSRDTALCATLNPSNEKALFPVILLISLWLIRWNLDDLFLTPAVRDLLGTRIRHGDKVLSGLAYFYACLGVPAPETVTLDELRRRQCAPAMRRSPRAEHGKGVNLFGYFDGGTGISRNALFSRDILQDAGFGVAMPLMAVPSRHAGEELYPVNLIHFGILGTPGDMVNYGLERFAGAYNIGFFLWETSTLPRSAGLTLDMMDEVWTLSSFCAKALAAQFDGPIHVVPNCVDERVLCGTKPAEKPAGQPFTFYFCFDARSWYTRKNPLAVARAFQRAFPNGEPVRLLLGIRYRQTSRTVADLAHKLDLDHLIRSDRRIVVHDRDLSYTDSLAAMRQCDCYVSLHRAEGFGYTMAEAMMLGKPVIASRYSANLDYMTDETAFLVDGRERYLEVDEYIDVTPGARWFEPDIDAAAAAMRRVWNDRDEAGRRASAGAAFVRRAFSRPRLQALYAERLEVIYRERSQRMARPAAGEPARRYTSGH